MTWKNYYLMDCFQIGKNLKKKEGFIEWTCQVFMESTISSSEYGLQHIFHLYARNLTT